MADCWDRLWIVFSWAHYWLNISGWSAEVQGIVHLLRLERMGLW